MLSKEVVELFRKDIRDKYPSIYRQAFDDNDQREILKGLIEKEEAFQTKVKKYQVNVDELLMRLVGLDVIDELKEDERVTDVAYDGTHLVVEGNGIEKYRYKRPNGEPITQEDMETIVSKMGSVTDKELSPKNPIMNTSMKFIRLSAVDEHHAPYGMTAVFRFAKAKLFLTPETFDIAPKYVLDLLRAMVKSKGNILIAGEVGTGKTELQKLLISFVPFAQRMAIIETVIELYAKELFPDKDILSWLATPEHPVEEFIERAALRGHPVWIIIQEIIEQEAWKLVQSILTGHRIITTLHAIDCNAIPQRLLTMAKMGYDVQDESFLDNIYRYVDFGIHLEKTDDGERYIDEIVEFKKDHTCHTIFKQEWTEDGLIQSTAPISLEFKKKLIKHKSNYRGLPIIGESERGA